MNNNSRLLKQLLPYINKYRDARFLFVVPSCFLAQDAKPTLIWEDIAACSTLGIECLVFIDYDWQLAAKQGIAAAELSKKLPFIAEAEGLAKYKLSHGFHGYNQKVNVLSGSWLLARPKGVIKGKDMQSHGKLRSIDRLNMLGLLGQGSILILSNLAPDKNGKLYALDTTDAAAELASQLRADKVILYVDNLAAEHRQLAVELSDAKKMLKNLTSNSKQDAFAETVRDAISYSDKGINRTHILPGYEDGALLQEILTADGYGFMVNLDDYEQLTTADYEDASNIKGIISPWEAAEALRPRSIEDLQRNIANFCVIKQDNNIIGCAALSQITGHKGYAELECVVVRDSHKGQGYGRRLLQSMEKLAIDRGFSNLAVFTTQTSVWFEEAGYKPSKVKLPVPDYCRERNSKCLVKTLKKTKSTTTKA